MITVGQYLIKQLEEHEHKVFKPTGYYDKEALLIAAKTLDSLILSKYALGERLSPLESLGVN